jgi:D-alanyl-D-alanine carboxypeptidase/D-alanyl-D-alanine-endopeptidase (penicillin-binding protein 4)
VERDAWRTTAGYLAHPTTGNLGLLRSKIAAAGIRIAGGSVVTTTVIATPAVLASHSSPTIASIVGHALRESDNFEAEQMLSIQGWGPVRALSQAVGDPGPAYDGSGLSLSDRRTARGLVAVLERAHASAVGPLLQQSLPVACRTGTLKSEMCRTPAAGAVFAKTGTLQHAKTLAGYTTDAEGRWVTFSLVTVGVTSTRTAMNAIARAVLLLRGYSG